MAAGGLQPTEADDQVAQRGEVLRRMAGPNGAGILPESDIPHVVEPFDGPMTAAELLDLGSSHQNALRPAGTDVV